MEPTWLAALLSLAGLLAWGLAVGVLLCVVPFWLITLPEWLGERRRRRAAPGPARRPIEEVAADLRRLQARFHHPAAGTRYAKHEGVRRAYDAVLGEACDCLGASHLLEVLSPGPELDAERDRVEDVLWSAGLRSSDEAA